MSDIVGRVKEKEWTEREDGTKQNVRICILPEFPAPLSSAENIPKDLGDTVGSAPNGIEPNVWLTMAKHLYAHLDAQEKEKVAVLVNDTHNLLSLVANAAGTKSFSGSYKEFEEQAQYGLDEVSWIFAYWFPQQGVGALLDIIAEMSEWGAQNKVMTFMLGLGISAPFIDETKASKTEKEDAKKKWARLRRVARFIYDTANEKMLQAILLYPSDMETSAVYLTNAFVLKEVPTAKDETGTIIL